MWIELVAQSAEPGIACFGLSPQQSSSFPFRLLPLFNAEVQAAPKEEHECGLYRGREPALPMQRAVRIGHHLDEKTRNRTRRNATRNCSHFESDPVRVCVLSGTGRWDASGN